MCKSEAISGTLPPSSPHLYLRELLPEHPTDILDCFGVMQSTSTCLVVPSSFMMPAWLDVWQEQGEATVLVTRLCGSP